MRERDLIRRVWRRNGDRNSYWSFKPLRNKVQTAMRKAKSDYYLSTFSGSQSAGEIWSKLRHLGLVKAKSNTAKVFTVSTFSG